MVYLNSNQLNWSSMFSCRARHTAAERKGWLITSWDMNIFVIGEIHISPTKLISIGHVKG